MIPDGYGRHTPTLTGTKVVRAVSIDSALIPHLGDAINKLSYDYVWIEYGSTVDDIVQECATAVKSFYISMLIGQISYFLGALPNGWLPLDGTTYDQLDYPELVALLDSQFKNDVAETFTLPNVTDRFFAVSGNNYTLGNLGGSDTHTLSVDELPPHTHDYTFPITGATIGGAGPPLPVVDAVTPGTPTSATGSGASHENRPPFIALVAGVFCGRF